MFISFGALQQTLASQEEPAAAPGPFAARPMRTACAALAFALGFFALLLYESRLGIRTVTSTQTYALLAAAVLAAGQYLLLQRGLKPILLGVVIGLAGAFLSVVSCNITMLVRMTGGRFPLIKAFGFTAVPLGRQLAYILAAAALALLVAVFVGRLLKNRPEPRRRLAAGAAGAAAYLAVGLFPVLRQIAALAARMPAGAQAALVFGALVPAAGMFGVFAVLGGLCGAWTPRVKLRGAGLAWAILATAGMAFSLVFALGFAGRMRGAVVFNAQILLAAAGLTGYVLLLCKKRAGLYVVALAAGLILWAQFSTSASALLYGARQYASLLFASVLGALNPLFAYLSVRAADRAEAAGTQTAAR